MKAFGALLILLLPAGSFGQLNTYAVWENQSTSVYWLVSLDANTGVKTNIAPITGMTNFVAGNATAFDADSNHFSCRGLSVATMRLYTVDVISGNVLYNPVLAANLVGLNYNCNNKMFYALRVTGNNYDLVTVNPVNGVVGVIAPLSGLTGYVAESFSFDPHLQHYNLMIYSGGGYRLRSYDVNTGLLINDHPFPNNVTGHQYSCADTALYGLWENNNVYKLERINPSTGTHATIGVLAGVMPGFVGESSAMDMNGNYIYRGFDSNNNFALITIDASAGTVTNVTNTTDNAVGFENGMCCTDLTSSLQVPLGFSEVLLYPDPADNEVIVTYGSDKLIAVRLMDCLGQVKNASWEVHSIATGNFERNSVAIDISTLPRGIYFIQLIGKQSKRSLKFLKQ